MMKRIASILQLKSMWPRSLCWCQL